jgi:hypothetical protein
MPKLFQMGRLSFAARTPSRKVTNFYTLRFIPCHIRRAPGDDVVRCATPDPVPSAPLRPIRLAVQLPAATCRPRPSAGYASAQPCHSPVAVILRSPEVTPSPAATFAAVVRFTTVFNKPASAPAPAFTTLFRSLLTKHNPEFSSNAACSRGNRACTAVTRSSSSGNAAWLHNRCRAQRQTES